MSTAEDPDRITVGQRIVLPAPQSEPTLRDLLGIQTMAEVRANQS
jgi:hypothetical protein